MALFKEGDIVRLKYGDRHAIVNKSSGNFMNIKWLKSGKTEWGQYQQHFVLVTEEEKQKEGVTNMTALYEVKVNGEVKIATKLMEKSKTSWIMEIKGSGDVVVADAADVTEIMKYTVEVFCDGKTTHYEAVQGEYAVGDIFLTKGLQIARIVKVDSKSKNALAEFSPFAKLKVELL